MVTLNGRIRVVLSTTGLAYNTPDVSNHVSRDIVSKGAHHKAIETSYLSH